MTTYLVTWLIAANLVAFVLMILDKKFAESGARRISETTLLGWAVFGGAPGTFAASCLVRHKTRKQPFASKIAILCAAEIVLLGLWMLGFLDPLLHD